MRTGPKTGPAKGLIKILCENYLLYVNRVYELLRVSY